MAIDRADWHSGGDYPKDLPEENGGTSLTPTLSDSVKSDSAYEARVGLRFPVRALESLDWGFRLGYVMGPTAIGKIGTDDLSNPGNLATTKNEVKTDYMRLLLEGGNSIHFNDRIGLRLGVGLGIANAKTKQSFTNTGDPTVTFETNGSKSKTGLTWKFSPALVVNLQKTDLEIGLRYAQFPENKESDNTGRVKKWSIFGFFVGASF